MSKLYTNNTLLEREPSISRQQKSTNKQKALGIDYLRIKTTEQTRDLYDEASQLLADILMYPHNKRNREALAKMMLLEKLLHGKSIPMLAYKRQIEQQQTIIDEQAVELKAHAPNFLDLHKTDPKTPLPHTINQLPDNPEQLKTALSSTLIRAIKAEKEARHYKRLYNQQQELASALTDYNQELKGKLKEYDVNVDMQEAELEDDWN